MKVTPSVANYDETCHHGKDRTHRHEEEGSRWMEGDFLHEPLALLERILRASLGQLVDEHRHVPGVRLHDGEVIPAPVPHHVLHLLQPTHGRQ